MSNELSANTTLSHYRIVSKLGAGGMGEVYLAEDPKLGRRVALKVLTRELTESPERVQRFEREARAASALNHPNILTVYEIGESAGVHFIATEFIEGKSLRQRMQLGAMELIEVLDLGIQIASALAAAHEAGIVHRDIKPENIMVRKDRLVKVLDFGLAKLIKQDPSDLVMGRLYAVFGKKAEALKMLSQLRSHRERYVADYNFALVYAGLGEKDKAFEALEKSYRDHTVDMLTLHYDPLMDNLRSDSRFASLLRRVGLQ